MCDKNGINTPLFFYYLSLIIIVIFNVIFWVDKKSIFSYKIYYFLFYNYLSISYL